MTESESYRKYFQPFVQRGDLDTSPTMLLGAMTSGRKERHRYGTWSAWADFNELHATKSAHCPACARLTDPLFIPCCQAGPKALLQWLGVVTWFPALAPPEDPKTAVAGGCHTFTRAVRGAVSVGDGPSAVEGGLP